MAATYTRLGQATGELHYAREWIARVPFAAATVRTINPNTGNACIEMEAVSATGFGFAIPQGAHTRMGGYLRYPSSQIADDSLLLHFTVAGETSYSHAVHFDYLNSILSLIIDGSTVDTATFAECGLVPDAWIRFGWNFNPNGWFVFYVNGTSVLGYSGTVVANAVNGVFFGNHSILAGSQIVCYLDDVYIDMITGEFSPIVPPRKIFMAVSVASNGMFSDWNPVGVAQNYQAIDDPTAPDGDTTHNYADSEGQRDTFNMTSFTTPLAGEGFYWRIAAMVVQAVARKPNPSDDFALSLILYDGLNTAAGTQHPYVGPDYLVFWNRFENEPDGSSWSEEDVNGMECGYRHDLRSI